MKDKAILDLLCDESLIELSRKLAAKYADDLLQEVALLLLEMPDEKWRDINEGEYLRWYVVRTMMNMATSPRSNFAVKYRIFEHRYEVPAIVDEDHYDYEKEADLTLIDQLLSTYHWYDADMVKLWIEKGSYRKVAAATGIPFKSIGNTVRKTLDNLKDDYIKHHIERAVERSPFANIYRNIDDRPED